MRYVSFSGEDARVLRAFGEVAAPEFPRIAQEFYDRIREHEQAHAVFTGEDQIARLQASLVRWMHRLCSGSYDEAYFEETAKIGRVHVKVGLPQRYMLTAMALIRVALVRLAEERMGAESRLAREAITRLLDLELATMLETYREDSLALFQRRERVEKQAVDQTLRRTEHRYVNAVELARVLIIGLDARGEMRLFNREAERVTGYARVEMIGEGFVEKLMQEDLLESHGAIVRAALGGTSGFTVLNSAIRTKAGKHRDVRWQLAYAPSEADDEVVLFAIGPDTTNENALALRTRQHEKLAAVGTLAAGLAHEIRNPLNGAQLHVAFLERALKKGGGDPEMMEAVRVVDDEIKRLATLVSEFLDFARPRPPALAAMSVRAVCERALKLVAPKASGANVLVVESFPSRDTTLAADASKIEQVLLNVLDNAVDAAQPSGGGHVKLRVRRQPRHVWIEVEDDGPGLPSPDAPIFDAFFSTKPHGTGLGLAIAHRIVTDHAGDLIVESRPGRTVFRVSLPTDTE
jgi:PAS domain S-box-containing protein